jgi:hypothetical protein
MGSSLFKIMTREIRAGVGPQSRLNDMGRTHYINRVDVIGPGGPESDDPADRGDLGCPLTPSDASWARNTRATSVGHAEWQ